MTIVCVLAGASLPLILDALLAIPAGAAIQIVLHGLWADRDRITPPAT